MDIGKAIGRGPGTLAAAGFCGYVARYAPDHALGALITFAISVAFIWNYE